MSDFLTVLALACIPAAGNFAGGVLAELVSVSKRTLNLALHGAAGIILAVVSVELMPRALEIDATWIVALCFVGGGVFFVLIDAAMDLVASRFGRGDPEKGPWLIYFAVAIDLLTDGILVGTGGTIGFQLALLLALGQVAADLPEGFATIATLRQRGVPRRTRFGLSAAFLAPVLLGCAIGYFAVRDASDTVKLGLLVFAAGVLVTVTVEEIIPEAHDEDEGRLAALSFVGGFALFILLSGYLSAG